MGSEMCIFFFQAEDGIRDRSPSRGLGDVYKRQELRAKTARLDELNILLNMDKKENEIVGGEPDEGEAVGGRKEKSYER